MKACLNEQGRSTLPRRSSSFTTAGSPDSCSSAPDSFTLGSLASDRQTSAGRATPGGASALGSTRQHGSSSSLDTTAGVQGSPGTSASPLSSLGRPQHTPSLRTRYAIVTVIPKIFPTSALCQEKGFFFCLFVCPSAGMGESIQICISGEC